MAGGVNSSSIPRLCCSEVCMLPSPACTWFSIRTPSLSGILRNSNHVQMTMISMQCTQPVSNLSLFSEPLFRTFWPITPLVSRPHGDLTSPHGDLISAHPDACNPPGTFSMQGILIYSYFSFWLESPTCILLIVTFRDSYFVYLGCTRAPSPHTFATIPAREN